LSSLTDANVTIGEGVIEKYAPMAGSQSAESLGPGWVERATKRGEAANEGLIISTLPAEAEFPEWAEFERKRGEDQQDMVLVWEEVARGEEEEDTEVSQVLAR
jgi:hypothetical protein